MKRNVSAPEDEPEQMKFEKPSEGEHLFQVVDIYDNTDAPGKMKLDEDTVCVKCEVAIGDELGRSLLQRCSLNPDWKGFFATRMFLKAIGEEYKGDIEIDTDRWIGRQFYATVVHNDGYANIGEYNFDKTKSIDPKSPEDISWDE